MWWSKLSEATAARRRVPVYLVDATDGFTPETGVATPTIEWSKNGAAQNAGAGTWAEVGDGVYYYEPTTGEIDTLGWANLRVLKSGVSREYQEVVLIVAYDPFDSVRSGLSALPNAAAGATGGLATIDANLRTLGNLDAWRGTQPAALNNTLVQSDVERWLNVVPLGLNNQLVQVDVERWVNVAVSALQAGRVDVYVGAMAAAVLSATAIADGAITAVKAANLDVAVSTRAPEVGGNVAAIKAKTDNLPAVPAAVGSQMTLQDDAITAAKIAASAITSSEAPALANLDAAVSTRALEAGGNVAAIKTKTDNLPVDPADESNIQTSLGIIAGYLDTEIADIRNRLPASLVGGRMDASVGAMAANVVTDAALAADTDTYQAKVLFFDDNVGATDRYAVVFFKNGQPVTAGITTPTLQVLNIATGADLIAEAALTQIGALGLYRFFEGSNRLVSGAGYIAVARATIDAATRTWHQPVGRDS